MSAQNRAPDDPREESQGQRLDRNTIELLNELRVAGTGIQVMFAFLLVVPFNKGWPRVDSFERTVYFVTLLIVAASAFLLTAPAIHHRILFRQGQKSFLVHVANDLAIIGMSFLALGFIGILVLLSDFVLGGAAPLIVGLLAGSCVGGLWFLLPIVRRDEEDRRH